MGVPCVKVGIFNEPVVNFHFHGTYLVGDMKVTGAHSASVSSGKVLWNGVEHESVLFTPTSEDCDCFELKDVTIGVNFHWERKEDQKFRGALKLIVENDRVTAINILSVEEYLLSVISSEMSATASLELLKAHAVISRSWLLAQIEKNQNIVSQNTHYCACHHDDEQLIRWYDREDHTNFDVCADDHCQRYQGITRASTQAVRDAIQATWGQVVTFDGKLCDARFSKCCGGVFEQFENCWEPVHHPYLEARCDSQSPLDFPDLTVEENAAQWILSAPQAFCNTRDAQILSQVLNNYDQETADFYRWRVEYSQAELSALVRSRSGVDYGDILDLVPVERGTSGRLVRLTIVGSKKTLTIGKELEIRRTLSTSHLYSSAFVVDKLDVNPDGVPQKFVLTGAGWGHGVGLCQIGAAVMGARGYNYKEILLHYFTNANITTLYNHE